MCGITGAFGQIAQEDLRISLSNMSRKLVHRGPDDYGTWFDYASGIGMAHSRLSILDLSPAGHQPMVSASGRFVIAFNGEIYNHQLLRNKIESTSASPVWRGHSDTEILLAAIEAWGFVETLNACVGMFALALWDRDERTLLLARDRMGEKPLYYGWQSNTLLFGSELKALKAHPAFVGEIDRHALAQQLKLSYIPAPHTIYKGINKLPPGTYLKSRIGHSDSVPVTYWSMQEVVSNGLASPFAGSDAEAVAALDAQLRESIAMQMMADVPLGAFLSGGVDSSTIVALMQAQSMRPVKTFTIGFHEEGYDEAKQALAVAHYLGTEHTELYVSHRDAMDVIPRLPTLYDEPFSDPSQIPTFLVSQMTREHVTISLSGDGGDELFGGYNRYLAATKLFRKFAFLPHAHRHVLTQVLSLAPIGLWDYLGRLGGISQGSEKALKIIGLLNSPDLESMYGRLVSHWFNPEGMVIGSGSPSSPHLLPLTFPHATNFENRMMFMDAVSYLPDDILVKVDRAAMGVGLETRVPMLDHRLVEFAWRLPLSMKIRDGVGKWILRQVLYKYVPQALIDRPKMGFGVPIDSWLRGPLRDWAENLLEESRLRHEGYFHPEPIRQKWTEHLTGQRNWQYHLWDVLMFQAWLEQERRH